jgi:chitodextrinase
MKKISLICLGIFLLPNLLLAVSDEFTMKVLVGDDIMPPTTPTLLSVVPVASSQIDVIWSTSVDNYLLSGYVLSRDGLPLATTTLTSFIDTGLAPETLYTYEVYAFDASGNISTTSNQLATTTLAVPVVATSTPTVNNPTSSTKVVALKDLQIITGQTRANLIWQTNFPSRYALRWGQTESYTGGYVLNDVYRTDNETTITDLEPGTRYYYELLGYSPNGIAMVLSRGQFTTQASSQPTYVPNVARLEGEALGNDVVLKWLLPETTAINSIRVVRSHLGFPTDIYDGAIVFDGIGTTIKDIGALEFYTSQYYSVFVVGEDGTISSGAVVLVRQNEAVVIQSGEGVATSPVSTSTPGLPVTEEIPLFGLELQNIILEQGEQKYSFLSEEIGLVNTQEFTISIGREALPEHLKSIIVTLLDPTDQRRSYSFLLRINKTGNAYEATIAPLMVVGASRLQVEIFDFERKLVGRYRKPIELINPPSTVAPVIFPDAILATAKDSWPILTGMLLVMSLIMFLIWRRKNETEDKLSVDY